MNKNIIRITNELYKDGWREADRESLPVEEELLDEVCAELHALSFSDKFTYSEETDGFALYDDAGYYIGFISTAGDKDEEKEALDRCDTVEDIFKTFDMDCCADLSKSEVLAVSYREW